MQIAVIGGGINGIMIAWRLAQDGHAVELFERDTLMAATSAASSKLLHGGLRYLENGEWRLVREALHERVWWIGQAPQLAHPLPMLLPIYNDTPRPRWQIGLGLHIYQALAWRTNLGPCRWLTCAEALAQVPQLRPQGLQGAYLFYDGQMDDRQLGLWAAQQARQAGAVLSENMPVQRVDTSGNVSTSSGTRHYDRVINVAGPWAQALLEASGIASSLKLDLVRGSHLLLPGQLSCGVMLQMASDRRVVFALPYRGAILLGTTEVRQQLSEPIVCSAGEVDYLLQAYNARFHDERNASDIVGTQAGVRPLIRSANNPTRATREYALERHGHLLSVFGGKWTTSRALAEKVAKGL